MPIILPYLQVGSREENSIFVTFGLAFKVFYLRKSLVVLSSRNLMLDIKFVEVPL